MIDVSVMGGVWFRGTSAPTMTLMHTAVPVIDVAPFIAGSPDGNKVVAKGVGVAPPPVG